ncbi:MAG: DegT/DnrJ/EryC1/StrS family aminotransferase [Bryobacteraceae bacterium]|nr:DegT/DnrJ/EryC1/StrS family aminotransferase [Bryobacteraceae bacterium]
MQRRTFVGAASAAAAAGAPVEPKKQPIRVNHWGPDFYGEPEQQQLVEVLESRNPFRWYAGAGSKVLAFEKEFAARMGTRYALGVTSGTAALQVAMAALEIGPGDEVILPAWTWHSCFNAVVLAGALPVIAEIDETFNIDPNDIERHITPGTKAILAVHLQGNPCRIDKVLEIARKHKLRVIEDCAQSVGASFQGRALGSLGDIGIYSLQQNKTITAGEGGAVVTSDPVLFERASRFHDLGEMRGPHVEVVGGAKQLDWFIGANYRMNEFTGGVLLAQVRKLDRIVAGVRAGARRVYEGIADLPGLELRMRPDPAGELGTGVFVGFRDKARRDRFVAGLRAEGIPAGGPGGSVVLPLLPHVQKKSTVHPAWPSFTSERGKAIHYGPESCRRTVSILDRFGGPTMGPRLTRDDTDRIVAAVRHVYGLVQAG